MAVNLQRTPWVLIGLTKEDYKLLSKADRNKLLIQKLIEASQQVETKSSVTFTAAKPQVINLEKLNEATSYFTFLEEELISLCNKLSRLKKQVENTISKYSNKDLENSEVFNKVAIKYNLYTVKFYELQNLICPQMAIQSGSLASPLKEKATLVELAFDFDKEELKQIFSQIISKIKERGTLKELSDEVLPTYYEDDFVKLRSLDSLSLDKPFKDIFDVFLHLNEIVKKGRYLSLTDPMKEAFAGINNIDMQTHDHNSKLYLEAHKEAAKARNNFEGLLNLLLKSFTGLKAPLQNLFVKLNPTSSLVECHSLKLLFAFPEVTFSYLTEVKPPKLNQEAIVKIVPLTKLKKISS